MRSALTLVIAALLVAMVAAPAAAQADRDCADFDSQEDAQAWFEAHDDNLDGDDDGVACEEYEYASSGAASPTRVETGAGGMAGTSTTQSLAGWATLSLAAATALAYAAYRQVSYRR